MTTASSLFAFALPNTQIMAIMTHEENNGCSMPESKMGPSPQETIEAASDAANAAEKIFHSAIGVYNSAQRYDHESWKISTCPKVSCALRKAQEAEKAYYSALMHQAGLVEVPDGDNDKLLLATARGQE